MKRFDLLKIYLTLGATFLFLGENIAQDTLSLDFRGAVELALQSNVAYQTQLNAMEILEKEKQVAKLSHLPSVGFSTRLAQLSGQQFQQIEGEIVVTNVTNEIVTSGLNVNMPLFIPAEEFSIRSLQNLPTMLVRKDWIGQGNKWSSM